MSTDRLRPNVVFILVDDMGYGDFSAFNGGLSNTPALDALLAESVCLTQHYTASPVCNPSRAALLTGRYPHRTGSIDTLEWWGLERLALRETTLADLFKTAGYATGLVGKWHLGAFDPRYHPNRRGFDEAVCFRGGMHDYIPCIFSIIRGRGTALHLPTGATARVRPYKLRRYYTLLLVPAFDMLPMIVIQCCSSFAATSQQNVCTPVALELHIYTLVR
ncbi:MAG: hypothetical protein FJ011_00265 [Chloroflexi bacterium]|nr:hypothetical protein [Chloroflexota bacterium]